MRLFIIALEEEFPKSLFDISKFRIVKKKKVFLLNKQNILVFSDVGVINAAQTLMTILNEFPKINHIINLGTAGSVNENIFPGDVVIAERVQFLDVDLTKFGYELNQFPRSKKQFKTNELLNEKIYLNYENKNNLFLGCVGTSNSFISKENKNNFKELHHCFAVDMEVAAIATICDNLSIDFNSIKVISDSIFLDKSTSEQFNENLDKAKISISSIFKLIMSDI